MDIYQIWTTYNKKWSKYEILAFSVLLLLTVIVVAGCVCRKKINIIQAMAIVTMVIFLGIVFGSTVFTRTSTIRQYELIPFWSWKAIFKLWTMVPRITQPRWCSSGRAAITGLRFSTSTRKMAACIRPTMLPTLIFIPN